MTQKNRSPGSALAGPPPQAEPGLKAGELNDSVYRRVKELILSGRLRPGVRLVHQDLADQLSVSRTPVRESLERLFQEGYAGRLPRRGYFVAELGMAEVQDLYQTREALELFAYDRMCEAGISDAAVAELAGLNATYAEMFPESMSRRRLQVDHDFHIRLASLSGNDFLCRTLDTIFDKTNLKRRLDGQGLVVGDAPLKDHQALVSALAERRYTEGRDLLRAHIREACLRLLRHLELNSAALGDDGRG